MNESIFLDSMFDASFNERRAAKYIDVQPSFLCSFPRSGNGWVRTLIAAAFLVENGYDISCLTKSYIEKGGVRYAALNYKGHAIEVEGLVPDIYGLDKHTDSIQRMISINKCTRQIIKTHHVLLNCSRSSLLIREPSMCIPSALLLLFPEVIDIDTYLLKVAKAYSSFFAWHLERIDFGDNIFILNHSKLVSDPVEHFSRYYEHLEIEVSNETIKQCVKKFPFMSNPTPKENVLSKATSSLEYIYGECSELFSQLAQA